MATWLLDGNVLVALCLDGHEHHALARAWLASHDDPFATCPVTQGTLLRVHMRFASDPGAAAAWETLRLVCALPRHRQWLEGPSYLEVSPQLLQGPKQVTDAWLAELARRHQALLATLDGALAALHRDVARLILP